VLGSLLGRRPPVLVGRPPRASTSPHAAPAAAATASGSATSSARAARSLRVAQVRRLTSDAVAIALEDPSGRPIPFVPGQFLTVLVEVGGELLRRAYSISSSHLETGRVEIAVKRVSGGRVSNHLNDNLRAGETLAVLGPSGHFTLESAPARRRKLVLFAGGSGITPILAIARAAAVGEPETTIYLVYGNRRAADIMYREELDALAAQHPDTLRVRHVLSEPPAGWSGGRGILDPETALTELDRLAAETQPASEGDTLYYLCGPEPMMAAVRGVLAERGVAAEQVFEERFSSPHLRNEADPAAASAAQPAEIRNGDAVRELIVAPGQTLLDAGLAASLPMPFSCTMGGCGACKVKLVEGSVASEEPNCLGDDEREAGYVLACVSRPTAPVRVEVG
jgi:ring-1,2-phenylacetyl-CoA epoxidase subunit PaaE